MRPSFNLVDQPWILCLVRPGRMREFGLEDTLIRSHELKEIVHESPLVVASLHRLLLALLHRIFGPPNMDAWVDLWNQGAWDAVAIHDYFHQWRDRFDLFHPEYPFYQTSKVVKESKNGVKEVKTSPVQRLAQQLTGGNNKLLFDHSVDQRPVSWSPAEAARYLIAEQNFALGGGVSYPFNLCDGPATKGLNVLALGFDLFQTLALNLIPYNDRSPMPNSAEDKPAWEYEKRPGPQKNGSKANGYLDFLTWQSRQIQLLPSQDNRISDCRYQQCYRLHDSFDRDPFKAYLVDKNGTRPYPLSLSRVLWRDSSALFQEMKQRGIRPPYLFYHLANVQQCANKGRIKAQSKYRFQVFGMASEGKAANIVMWRREVFPLPLAYLTDPGLLSTLNDTLAAAENIGRELEARAWWFAAHTLYPGSAGPGWKPGKSHSQEISRLRSALRPTQDFWAMLENPFRRLLVELADAWAVREDDEESKLEDVLARWAQTLRGAAFKSFEVMVRPFQGTGRGLKAIARAEVGFGGKLERIIREHGLLEPDEDEEEEYGQIAS